MSEANVALDARGAAEASASDTPARQNFTKPLMLFGMSVALVLTSRLLSPQLGGFDQISSIIVLSSFLIVAAFGQQMVVLIGGLDLSVPSMITLGGIIAFAWSANNSISLLLGLVMVVVVTGSLGAMSGLGVTLLRVPPFIMTMSSNVIVYSIALGVTGGTPKGHHGSGQLELLFEGRILGMPPVILLIAVFIVGGIFLQSATSYGRLVYAIGTNPTAARIAGLPVVAITALTYAIGAAASGLCGMLLVGFSGGANLTMGQAYLLPSVAAVVVGGTAITGGRGDYLSVVAAGLLITTFGTVISSIQVAEGWRTIIYGVIVLIAIIAMKDGAGRSLGAIGSRIWTKRNQAHT